MTGTAVALELALAVQKLQQNLTKWVFLTVLLLIPLALNGPGWIWIVVVIDTLWWLAEIGKTRTIDTLVERCIKENTK